MVGGHGENSAIGEGMAQGVAVGSSLHGRVALYACAKSGVVGIGEEEMGDDRLGGNQRQCAIAVVRFEEFQFTPGGDMGHMQPCPILPCQCHGM